MTDQIPMWSWVSLILLGSVHGINPAMGWLFAVALGVQKRSSKAVVRALGPIVLGHALSITMVAIAVIVLGSFLPQPVVTIGGGLCMIGFAAYRVITRFRHKTRYGMKVNSRDLTAWSFLMATAHGAGLMLVPPLLAMRSNGVPAVAAEGHDHHHHHIEMSTGGSATEQVLVSVAAVGMHSLAMLGVTAVIAMVVYQRVGVDILRKAWINIDLIWIGVLALAGLLTLTAGTYEMLG